MTDFQTWDRKTLEQFARDAAEENKRLREDIRTLLAAWRQVLTEQERHHA